MQRTARVSSLPFPKQARSRRTFERLLDAAESLLAEKSFEQAGVTEIAAKAGFTVGALYARFPTKLALLESLAERVSDRYQAALARVAELAATGMPLGSLLDGLVDAFVSSYSERGWVATSAALRSSPVLRKRVDRLNAELLARISELLLERREEMRHADPVAAVEFSLLMISTTLREIVVFHDYWPKKDAAHRERAIAELKRAVRSYLNPRK